MNYAEIFDKIDENLVEVIEFLIDDYNMEHDTRIDLTENEKDYLIRKIKDIIYTQIESKDI